MLSSASTKELIKLACDSIEYFLETKNNIPYDKIKIKDAVVKEELETKMPAFVLLKKKKEVRGVSGVFETVEEVGRLVCQLAVNAAFFDARTPRLKPYELNEIKVHLLFPQNMKLITTKKEEAIANFSITKQGLYMASRGRFAYALPYLWEEIPDAEVMIRMLQMQLGITKKSASSSVEYYEFTCEESIES